MKKQNDANPIFSLRFRLILLVALELVASVLLAVWLSDLIHLYIPEEWDVPLILYLLVISLAVGILITMFLSRLFFAPVKRLRQAMAQVAKGDFDIQLHTRSKSREIVEIYSGFNLMTRELRSMEILQTDFVSNVSHEFKTPLGALEGYSTLLQDCENLTPQQQIYVEKILFNTRRMSTLTGSVLLLSKLDNQQIPTGRTAFSLDEQIRQSIVDLEPVWSEKNIQLDMELEEITCFGNEVLMRHVWSNLLGNALKFSPPGSTVEIGLEQQDGQPVFWVRDYGPGIPEAAMEHIFNRFYQADSSHKQEGNGLGLALVDKILKLEKGSVQVENCEGGGCKFTVRLTNE